MENTDTPKQNPPHKGSRSTSSKSKGKYGSSMGWRYNAHREPSNVPALISPGPGIQFYWIKDLECPGTERCDLRTVDYKLPTSTRFMNQAIHTPPSDTWLKPRVEGGIVTPAIRDTYLHALECMRQAIQSPYDRRIQDRHTGGWHDCEGRFAPPTAPREKTPYWYYLPYESNKLGDFIRVLRNRPCKMGVVPQLEYVPNSMYSFAMVHFERLHRRQSEGKQILGRPNRERSRKQNLVYPPRLLPRNAGKSGTGMQKHEPGSIQTYRACGISP